MGLSFHGALDDFAHESVVKTTNQSILILAIAGAVDAAISFFQAVKIPFLEIPVGELLDPLNDTVERLLSVMVWAVGSLTLQRIIIEVASSSAFKWAFFGIGLIAITTWLLGTWQRVRDLFGAWDGFSALLVRIFIYLAVLRFIVPVFAILSFLVGHLLFDAELTRAKEDLSLFSAGISLDDSTPLPGTPEFEEQRALKASDLDELRERMASYTEEAMSIIYSIPETIAGSAVRGFGFAFGRDIYSATKKRSRNILLIAIAVAVLLMNYVSVLWIVRNYQTASQSVLAKLGGLIVFAASYALVFVVSTWVGEEGPPVVATVIVVVQHGLILAGLINGLRHRRKRRLVWEVEDHNADFFLEHGIEELDEEHYRDSEGNRYRLEHVRPSEIELFAEGRRGKRAYIGVDEEGRFTTWSRLVSI